MNGSRRAISTSHPLRACVVGAGVAGLAASLELALHGYEVELLERAAEVGGKMRQVEVAGRPVDCGPTVLTMRWVFEELFARAGASLTDHVRLHPLEVLARHAWPDGSRLDLYADVERTADAMGDFAGASAAQAYRSFAAHTQRIYEAVRGPFLLGQRPSFWSMMTSPTIRQLSPLAIDAHRTMHASLSSFFEDPRLVQLFGRYATYVGSSPFEAPGTLNLIAHVEREGVHCLEGGMASLAAALRDLAVARGVSIHCNVHVEEIAIGRDGVRAVLTDTREIPADVVVYAGDVAALAQGALGKAAQRAVDYDFPSAKRSLSALTLASVAETSGFPLAYHNVFFGDDPHAEFDDLFARRTLPRSPTVYVCAQDRIHEPPAGAERLFFIVNAPADAEQRALTPQEIDTCDTTMTSLLTRAGLELATHERVWTTPTDFAARFPGSAGALYGRASHGMFSALSRPAARTKVKGLVLAGGSVHPGAGVPMAALSGMAAAAALTGSASIDPSRPTVIAGSTSTA